MNITIAGYGNIGQIVETRLEGIADTRIYDPPKGLGRLEDLKDADMVFVAVPTPSLEDGRCDTSIVEQVVAAASPGKAIVCHSTVSIGTTERLINTYGKPVVYVPEYAGESSDHPYRSEGNRAFFIFGGYEPATSEVQALFEQIYGEDRSYFRVPPATAEVVKYMENSFLALKVGFCNEYYDLCQALDIDYDTVRHLWLQDGRISPSHTLVTQERGYGGSCLPKDVAAVCSTGKEVGTPMIIMEAARQANRRHKAAARVPHLVA